MIHVVRDLDVSSGGPSRSVPALAEHQSAAGAGVSVFFRDRGQQVIRLPSSSVKYHSVVGGALSKPRDLQSMLVSKTASETQRIVHLHGLWDPLLHRSARLARASGLPYVVSTRGMLAGWAIGHKAWKKKIAWRLYQHRDLESADCLVASSEFERRDVSALVEGKGVRVIPNGCRDLPESPLNPEDDSMKVGARWALALGRLHPVKGYAELIETWARLRPVGWKLAIAGPDEDGYRSVLERLIIQLELENEVVLLGAVDEQRKWTLYGHCELFLAPSKTENFGMAIAEALQSGTPVITTKGTPWQELVQHDCGWWIELNPGALEQALGEATGAAPEELKRKGGNGRNLIETNYSWQRVAEQSLAMYREILAGGGR